MGDGARLRVTVGADERVRVTFSRGEAEVELRFPYAPEDRDRAMVAADDLSILTDNIHELIAQANTEIEVALLRQELDAADQMGETADE